MKIGNTLTLKIEVHKKVSHTFIVNSEQIFLSFL
jgi:hypothetical protein